MTQNNALYAQSGGVTAVINATAASVIQSICNSQSINKLYLGLHGIVGVLQEELMDADELTTKELEQLRYSPGGAFGSCRYKLSKEKDFQRILQVFAAHGINYFFYNGGGDSQDTTYKLQQFADKHDYPLTCIGIPKTIDNDLPFTDTSPGFASAAKYIAISCLETSLDLKAMHSSSTKVFILETMGRNTGWLAAAAGLAKQHIILLPEVAFDKVKFLNKVEQIIQLHGYCCIAVAEGIKDKQGKLLTQSNSTDSFGHAQLGGVGNLLSQIIQAELKLKCHVAIADYMQRSARHIASKTDVQHAKKLGQHAVKLAETKHKGVMPILVRKQDTKGGISWHVTHVELNKVANIEKTVPNNFISRDGFNVTQACIDYLHPLIQGEDYPMYLNGLPYYLNLTIKLIPKKLPNYQV